MSKLLVQYILPLSILLTLIIFNIALADPILSCSQTPYPQVCTSMISSTNTTDHSLQDKSRTSFPDLVLKSTLDHAILIHRLASSMNITSFDAHTKFAWLDCLELYHDTIELLNRSSSSSYEDAQTWLSAAVADLDTCKNGFIDFGLSSKLRSSPFLANNISESIGNMLAINQAAVASSNVSKDDWRLLNLNGTFPEWVSKKNRKLLQHSSVRANIVVAQDGSGNYRTISEAVTASPRLRIDASRFVIYVKAGVYTENVEVEKWMPNLMIVGDGIDRTIVTGSRNVQGGFTTRYTATFGIKGDGFIARDMTFENTAGPRRRHGQAVALRSESEHSVFYRCSFKGYQDTLYVHSKHQFYRNCDIYGTTDIIFGDASVVLQNCNIYVRRPLRGQQNTVTAQGRELANEPGGIVIHNSKITAARDLKRVQHWFKSYLGRPWKLHSRTVIMKTFIDSLIDPAGWLEWKGNFALSTLYYAEYMNWGPGSNTFWRVKWPGYRGLLSKNEARRFTVAKFLMGKNNWIPATGVPFTARGI